MAFTRVKELRAMSATLPKALSGVRSLSDGAAVTFLIFDPDMQSLVAKTGRTALQADPKSIRDTKKEVEAALERWENQPATSDADTDSATTSTSDDKPAGKPTRETWTNTGGKKLYATFRAIEGDEVLLLNDSGVQFRYPLAKLSEQSRERAKALAGQ